MMKIKLKFRKRIKFSLGFTINFSKSGTSITIGIKDTSINTGKKLFFLNTIIPNYIYDCKKLGGFSIKTAKKIK